MSRSEAIASGIRRRPSEQQLAAQQLRTLAKRHRFRVQADTEGFPIVPGRYGQIEWFDGESPAVFTNRPRLFEKLWTIPGVRRHQTGDAEMRAVFPPEALDQVAAVIKARRRRTLSSEEACRRGSKPTHRATSGLQKPRSMATEGRGLGELGGHSASRAGRQDAQVTPGET